MIKITKKILILYLIINSFNFSLSDENFFNKGLDLFKNEKFEDARFSEGTSEVAKLMSQSSAYSIIGGGETITSFANINLMNSVNYASTAGGAFLEYIENKSLPCIDKIIKKNNG